MKSFEFQRKVRHNARPIIVDLWAPWCKPCKAMEPGFKQVSAKYAGRVDVLKVNADESQEVLKALGVMSIPTVIGFAGGKEIIRRTGLQAPDALDVIFDSTLHQRKPVVMPPAPIHRVIRTILGLALMAVGWFSFHQWWVVVLGGVVLWSAFYDRCPLYKAVVTKLKDLFHRPEKEEESSQ